MHTKVILMYTNTHIDNCHINFDLMYGYALSMGKNYKK